jgi:sulfite oxidase
VDISKHDVVATIQCGGNRRSEMNKVSVTAGTSWGVGAMSNAKWSGAKLRDVLLTYGITEVRFFVSTEELFSFVRICY